MLSCPGRSAPSALINRLPCHPSLLQGSPGHSLHASPSRARLHASPSNSRLHASPSPTRLPASPSRLDNSTSSPALGYRRRAAGASPLKASPMAAGAGRPVTATAAAAAAESSLDSGGQLGLSGSGNLSTLLLPTASYVAGVEETKRLRQERQRGEESLRELSSYQPQPTEVAPFKLKCDQRAEGDWARVGPAGQLTTEESRALEVGRVLVRALRQERKGGARQRRTQCSIANRLPLPP